MNISRKVTDDDVKKMLIAFDTNNDGKINKEEFRALAEKCIK